MDAALESGAMSTGRLTGATAAYVSRSATAAVLLAMSVHNLQVVHSDLSFKAAGIKTVSTAPRVSLLSPNNCLNPRVTC
jgi:hypothetical protein